MRFSLLGVPVYVRPAFWLVGLMLSSSSLADGDVLGLVSWTAIVFVSILVHEMGHAAVMRAFGRTPRIELWALGGLTFWGEGPRVGGARRIAVSLAGPFAGFALAGPFAALAFFVDLSAHPALQQALSDILFVNVFWGLFNLVPMLPLDGGHVMEVLVGGAFGERGPKLARVLSVAVSLGVVVAGIAWSQSWGAMLGLMCAGHSLRELFSGTPRPIAIPAQERPSPQSERALEAAWQAIGSGRAEEAIAASEASLAGWADDEAHAPLRALALETLAWAWIEQGDEARAAEAVARMPPRFAPSAVLAGRLLLSRDVEQGIRALERAYLDSSSDLAALVLAAAYVDLHRPDRAVAILRSLRGARVSSHGHLTISASLFHAGRFTHALEVSELGWNRFRAPDHAYNAACSCAKLDRLETGLDWIARALERGFTDRAMLEGDPDLAALRKSRRWDELLATLRA